MSEPAHPRDDLVRATFPGPALRDDAADGLGTLTGHFSVFDVWYEVDSLFEGRFMERVAPGAFADTIAEDRDSMRVTLNHGRDPQAGDKPLGPIEVLEEDGKGARYEVPLIDTSYNRDIAPGLRAGLYGSSMRFSVSTEEWDNAPRRTRANPEALPERTITRARVSEFGPVTFPANAAASAGVRSLTDEWRSALAPSPRKEPPTMTAPAATLPDSQYITRDEKAARSRDLKASLVAIGTEHPGVLPPEVQARWERENAEVDQLERDVAAWDERQARLRRFAADPEKVVDAVPAVISRPSESDIYDMRDVVQRSRTPEERRQRFHDNAMRAAEQLRVPSERYDQDRSRERLATLLEYKDSDDGELARLVLGTNSPAYREAFGRYVASGGAERGTALAVGVDGTGGFSVPVSFDPTIVAIGAWTAINPYRASCRVETIVGTDTWQALTATAIVAAYAAEAAAATEQGPTFARPEYIAKRAHSFVTASYEMAQDRPGLPAELGRLFGEAKDNLEEAQYTVGVGTTVFPQGIGLKDAFTRADSAGAAVAAVDVLAMEAALPIRHRMNGAWYLSRAAIRAIQAFETVNGQFFNGQQYASVGNPVNAPAGNTGLRLLGYPVWETPSMPWTPSTTDTTWGVLMDPDNYVILDRVGMSIKVIPDMLNGATPSFPTGEIGIYAFWRNTARVLNVDGGRQGGVQ
jgi:hypothetical protein